MIVISIGSERKMFSSNPTRDRILRFGESFEQYHLVVFSLRKDHFQKTIIGNAHVYPTNSRSKLLYIFDAINIALRIIRTISKVKNDNVVVSAQDPFEAGLAGYVVSKMKGVAFHLQIHTDLFSPYFKNTLLQYIRMLIAPWIIRGAHAIRSDSKRMIDVIKKGNLSHAPMDVLPIYIDTTKYSNSIQSMDVHDLFKEKRIVFLIASRLEPEKDLEHLVPIVIEMIKRYPQKVGLVIVGSGSGEDYLHQLVKQHHVEDDIRIVGWTNELQSYYRSADGFIVSSIFEGYCLTIAESLLCGTPVLSTDVGVAPEIIKEGKNGWICSPCDYECLRNKIHSLISNPKNISRAKQYLKEYPYVHPFADPNHYKDIFIQNIERAIFYKKAS